MMKYMRASLLLLCAVLLGCSTDTDKLVGFGSVQIQLTQDETVNIKKLSTLENTISYSMQIRDAGGAVVFAVDDIGQIQSPISLKEGQYTATATSNSSDTGFDGARYAGTASFLVVAGETSDVSLVCTLSNVKVSIAFTQTIKDNFLEYSADVAYGENTLTFLGDETRPGYVPVGPFDVVIKLKDIVGRIHSFTNSFSDASPRDHYKIVVDLATDLGSAGVSITVDPTTFDKICEIGVPGVTVVKTLGVEGAAGEPTVKGIAISSSLNLGFEYKRLADAAWTVVDPASIVRSSEADGKVYYQATLSGLPLDAKFCYRATLGNFKGEEGFFVTAEALPNLNFDTWTQSGKTFYPNAEPSNSFWATGNEGVTMSLVNKNSNTSPSDDAFTAGGKAARMETISVPFVNIAAGNLFTGTYKTNISNPASSVTFGRPYSYRPKALRGYYKYSPKIIDVAKAPHEDKKGQMDQCHIYLQLEDWGGESTRPSNAAVIGYGEFKSSEEVSVYTPFEFTVTYASDSRPTHVVLVATSSIYGGEFTGGIGSTLYVDNFELIFN